MATVCQAPPGATLAAVGIHAAADQQGVVAEQGRGRLHGDAAEVRRERDDGFCRRHFLEHHVAVPGAVRVQHRRTIGIERAQDLALVAQHDVVGRTAVDVIGTEPPTISSTPASP